jgi:hypothetical protein
LPEDKVRRRRKIPKQTRRLSKNRKQSLIDDHLRQKADAINAFDEKLAKAGITRGGIATLTEVLQMAC